MTSKDDIVVKVAEEDKEKAIGDHESVPDALLYAMALISKNLRPVKIQVNGVTVMDEDAIHAVPRTLTLEELNRIDRGDLAPLKRFLS